MTTTGDKTATDLVLELAKDAAEEIMRANEEIRRRIREARADLDSLERAVGQNLRVPSSVSGRPHFAGTAADLVDAIRDRQAAHDRAALIQVAYRHVRALDAAGCDR